MTQPYGPPGGGSNMVAPVKVCPNCGVQSQTVNTKCPHCGKGFKAKKSHTFRNVFLGIIAAVVLLFAGCTALIGGAANEAVKSLEADQAKSAISETQYSQIKIGDTRADLDKAVAPAVPADAQEFSNEGILDEENFDTACVYFNKTGGELGDLYQFCLDGTGARAKVTSKSSV